MEKGSVKIMNDAVMMKTEPEAETLSTITGHWYKYALKTREKLTEKQVNAIMLMALAKEGLDAIDKR